MELESCQIRVIQGKDKEGKPYLGRREVELNVRVDVLEVELGVEVVELLVGLGELVVVGVAVEEV